MRQSVDWIRDECERVGRDPATLRVYAGVTTAADCEEERLYELVGGRMALIFQSPDLSYVYCSRNGWDPAVMQACKEHPAFRDFGKRYADHLVNRVRLGQIAKETIPWWVLDDSSAIGSSEEVVRKLQEYRAAGAYEITIYGQTPSECERFVRLWRERPEAMSTRQERTKV